jgi:hypothetical protein
VARLRRAIPSSAARLRRGSPFSLGMSQPSKLSLLLFPELSGLTESEAETLMKASFRPAVSTWKVRIFIVLYVFVAFVILRAHGMGAAYFVTAAVASIPLGLLVRAEARRFMRNHRGSSHA